MVKISNKADLQHFFNLTNHPDLFDAALRPRSCGGDAKFEQLAMYGDRILSLHLQDILISEGFQTKGNLTQKLNSIHTETLLQEFAQSINIPSFMTPIDMTYVLQSKEIAEVVEALIGTSFKANGFDQGIKVIEEIYHFSKTAKINASFENQFNMSENYIGQVYELFQRYYQGTIIPNLKPIRIGGPAHLPSFQFIGDIEFNGESYSIESDIFDSKKKTEKHAAYLLLLAIEKKTPHPINYVNRISTMIPETEKQGTIKKSHNVDTLVFTNLFIKNQESGGYAENIYVSSETGESITEWVLRKSKKNAASMWMLLSARLNEVKGGTWTHENENFILAIMNVNLSGIDYFSIGLGPSKNKAKKNAGEKLLVESNLIQWLNIHYPNYNI